MRFVECQFHQLYNNCTHCLLADTHATSSVCISGYNVISFIQNTLNNLTMTLFKQIYSVKYVPDARKWILWYVHNQLASTSHYFQHMSNAKISAYYGLSEAETRLGDSGRHSGPAPV